MIPILEIQSVSKKFNIRHEGGSYLSMRDRLTELVKFKSSQKSNEEFWALKDVSFNVMPGESIGIIGKNGAGKSTLLKILSKITPPTQGKIISRGRIASLLEVGTGFHPELTGRENVYLNGSILGMRKKEIDIRFDEIVDFAGIEKFLDTPLKHYSSGMQLRLAFSVAAFLEPEILVIDEVLAVGDAEFQKKCTGKMEDVSRNGRTILFVSHNMPAVLKLCSKSILIEKGKLLHFGGTNEVSKLYQGLNKSVQDSYYENKSKADLFFKTITTKFENGTISNRFDFDQSIKIGFTIDSKIKTTNTTITIGVLNKNGTRIFFSEMNYSFTAGDHPFTVEIPRQTLLPESYSLYLALHIPNTFAFEELNEVCRFSVEETGSSPFMKYGGQWDCGAVLVNCKWTKN